MLAAALDCSQGAALAISRAGVVLKDVSLSDSGRESDRVLASWLVAQCADLGLSLAQIERWTVGTGPGSFAGLRCGIALVKGVCLSSRAAIRGVPSAYALAKAGAACLLPGQCIGALHDGRCGQVILSRFQLQDDGALRLLTAPQPHFPEELAAQTDCCCDIWVALAGQNLPELPSGVTQSLRWEKCVRASWLLAAPDWPWPSSLAQAEESCTPLYIRQAVFVRPSAVRKVK